MPPAELETAIPASERPQTYILERAATGIGRQKYTASKLVVSCTYIVSFGLRGGTDPHISLHWAQKCCKLVNIAHSIITYA